MAEEVTRYLSPKNGDKYLDLTAGLGGHAKRISEKLGSQGRMILVDRDEEAIEFLLDTFKGDKRVTIEQSDFYSASKHLLEQGLKFDCLLADLGMSSMQLDQPDRGFSFKSPGLLDMRFDRNQSLRADEVVNKYTRKKLAQILISFAELTNNQAYKLADWIISNRPIRETARLSDVIRKSPPSQRVRDIETRVFQAIRIEVNQELELLKKSLPIWKELLAKDGRLAVISFHSLEDVAVKQFFMEYGHGGYDTELKILTSKPITPSNHELVYNPRSHSAKLRAASRK